MAKEDLGEEMLRSGPDADLEPVRLGSMLQIPGQEGSCSRNRTRALCLVPRFVDNPADGLPTA